MGVIMQIQMRDPGGSGEVVGIFPADIRVLTPDAPSCEAYGTGEEGSPPCIGPAYVWEDEYGLEYDVCCVHSGGMFRVV
jgi:hypothetical protein